MTAPNAESQSPNTAKSNAATNGMTDAAPSKKVEQKARSTFYLPSASPIDPAAPKTAAPHPTSISITLEAGLGEEIASSTAASSDEDDDDDDEEDEGTWDGTLPNDREGGIAGGDSEETTPTAGASANLPDLVSQAFRKQVITCVDSYPGGSRRYVMHICFFRGHLVQNSKPCKFIERTTPPQQIPVARLRPQPMVRYRTLPFHLPLRDRVVRL